MHFYFPWDNVTEDILVLKKCQEYIKLGLNMKVFSFDDSGISTIRIISWVTSSILSFYILYLT